MVWAFVVPGASPGLPPVLRRLAPMPTSARRPEPPARSGGFVSPWEHGSRLYRGMVLTGSALFLIGIVLSVVGATAHVLALSWTALGVLGAGVLVHLSAQLVRLREAGRCESAARSSRRKGRGSGR